MCNICISGITHIYLVLGNGLKFRVSRTSKVTSCTAPSSIGAGFQTGRRSHYLVMVRVGFRYYHRVRRDLPPKWRMLNCTVQPLAKRVDAYVRSPTWIAQPFSSSKNPNPSGNPLYTEAEKQKFINDPEYALQYR